MTNDATRRSFLSGALATAAAPFVAHASSPPGTYPDPGSIAVRQGMANLKSVRLWFSDTGGPGEPLILLHPGTGSVHVWQYQVPAFARAGYRVITYSRRGHAGSEGGSPLALGTAADDLRDLADYLRLDRFHLVGSAAGGFIVPDFALSYPERLLSIVIACSQGGATDLGYRKMVENLVPPALRSLPVSIRELGPSYRAANSDGVRAWEALERISLSGAHRVRQPPKNDLNAKALSTIRTPTMLIAGGADLLSPPPVMRELARFLSDAPLAILSEAGHSGYWEQPDAFNRLVLDFIAKHGAGAPG